MTTDPSRDTRWRDEAHYQGRQYDNTHGPQASGPFSGNPALQNAHLPVDSYTKRWDGMLRVESDSHQRSGLPPMIDPNTDASTFRSRLYERHSPSRRNSIVSNNSPPPQSFNRTWQSLPLDQRTQDRNITDAPLSLHIPGSNGTYNMNSPTDRPKSHGLRCLSSHP